MDHLYQTTMLLPASYAVISEEEMTYLDGGKEILLGNVFGYDITFNTDQFVIFCQRLEQACSVWYWYSGRLLCIRSGRKHYPFGQKHLQRPYKTHADFQQRTGF